MDARQLGDGCPLRARVCVVGTGPAGVTVALTLADAGVDVLLLEGGGLRAEAAARETLQGHSADGQPLHRVRDKRLGGTSAQWGGRCLPLDESDLEGWPIPFVALEEYYRRAAEILDLGSWEWTAAEATPALSALLAGPGSGMVEDSCAVKDDRVWRWSPPVRFAEVSTARLRGHPRVRFLHHANVVRVLRQTAGGPVMGVEIAPAPRRRIQVTADVVVLAVGGLETARLLLVSDLGNESDQVGRHYMTHPLAEVGCLRLHRPAAAVGAASFVTSRDGVWVRRFLQIDADVRRREGLLNMAFALWYPDPRDAAHGDALLSTFALVRRGLVRAGGFKATGVHRRFAEIGGTSGHLRNVARDLPAVASFGRDWIRDRWLAKRTVPAFSPLSPDGVYRLRFDAEQTPDPENRVTLDRTRDAFGVPRLSVRHRVGADDRRNYHRSLELLAADLRATGTAAVEIPDLDEMLDRPMEDATHQMGLARMGASPTSSVVDSDCRVWSAPNLYIAGSAVFPTSGMAGPTMTIVALAVRLADHLGRTVGRPAAAGQR
jgi:choline dehydrogenase-like flavoprotein